MPWERRPDLPTIVLEQRPRCTISKSAPLTEDCCLSIFEARETIVRTNPNAPIRGSEYGLSRIARQSLFYRDSRNWEFSKPVEPSCAGNPDVALSILEHSEDDVTCKAIRLRKNICSAVMDMDEAPLDRPDPETSIAVPEDSIRIDLAVPKQTG